MQKLNFKLVLRADQPAKDGSCKIALHANINGTRVRVSLPVSIHPDNWDNSKQQAKPKGDTTRAQQVNGYLLTVRRKVEEVFFDHLNTDTFLTAEKFESAFDRKAVSGDLLVFMLNEINAAKKDQAEGTVKAWMSTYNHLVSCFGKVPYSDISLDLVKKFDAYLRKKKFEHNYISKHHSFLRKYILLANKKGKKVGNPYNDFRITVRKKEREYLTASEVAGLRALYDKKELPDHLQRALRHFLFQVATSLRYSDLAAISKENLIGDTLVFCPIKTQKAGKMVSVTLSEMAKAMLADSESTTDRLFGVTVEQTMNRYLKDIAAFAGISKRLTTHLGRHSFGFLFIAAGGQIEVLQKIMGHSDIKTTQVYTHIDRSQIRDGVARIDAMLSAMEV